MQRLHRKRACRRIQCNTIRYNTTLLFLCREICFLDLIEDEVPLEAFQPVSLENDPGTQTPPAEFRSYVKVEAAVLGSHL